MSELSFKSTKAKELAESFNITLNDFINDDNKNKIGKSDVEKKIKEIQRKKALATINLTCECCNYYWKTKQNYEKHLTSKDSLLYFAKKDIKQKDLINCQLSNKVSVLECRINDLNKTISKKDIIILQYQKDKREQEAKYPILEENVTNSESESESENEIKIEDENYNIYKI